MTIQFLGAAGEVTGSKHLITVNGKRILLDCGMFQGKGMETDQDNRNLGFEPKQLDYVLLTHAHIDHSGLIPYLYRCGFRGRVYCTPATADLCQIMFLDTAYILEQDVHWYNKKMRRQHQPTIDTLFDRNHAEQCMRLFYIVDYNKPFRLTEGVDVQFTDSGHMLGSAVISLTITENGETTRLAYTGDIGRPNSHILCPPKPFPQCDVLITESTYGDRLHEEQAVSEQELLDIVNHTCVYKRGKLIIPSFSVGRTQEIVYVLNELFNAGKLPKVEVYVDSPLSVEATKVFRSYKDTLNDDVRRTMETDADPFGFDSLHYITDINESKQLNTSKQPAIIISASGMMEAGRIKHHVANHIEDPSTTILIVGYCTPTSLGARIQDPKKKYISIFGFDHKIRAEIRRVEGFSGHGDYEEMRQYLKCQNMDELKRIFIVHGEQQAAETYKDHLYEVGFRGMYVPKKGETVEL